MAKAGRQRKGIFGRLGLPLAGRYLEPRSRRRELTVAAVLCLAVLAMLAVGWMRRGTRIVARAPLSSAHSTIEASCASCHQPFGGTPDTACLTCHESFGSPPGAFAAAAHAARFATSGAAAATTTETVACSTCHPEHRGRERRPVAVADATCTGCHAVGSFPDGHPEFRFAREELLDDRALSFPHRLHVTRVVAEKGLGDAQRACLYCHLPEPAGGGFAPLDFERQCGDCHLSSRTATPRLPVGDPAAEPPGVLTLEAIRAGGGPGTRWAWFANPAELEVRGDRVAKRPVYHADPWVMENLRRIRRELHPDEGLSGLLATLAPAAGATSRPAEATLYGEAIATLRGRVDELRGRPEPAVQAELARLERLLDLAEERLAAGEAPPDAFTAAAPEDATPPPERAAALRQLALDLTEPCRRCHTVSDGAIRRVAADQRTLDRARFDHRAHVLSRPLCVDCHDVIPDLMVSLEPGGTVDADDRAEVFNLPRIATCRECHTPRLASVSCVTCHAYHPETAAPRVGGVARLARGGAG